MCSAGRLSIAHISVAVEDGIVALTRHGGPGTGAACYLTALMKIS